MSPSWPQRPATTLLADRDANARKVYADFLKLSACEIEETDDGREALALAIAHRPDVLVTETQLAGIDGFELCTLLRTDSLTRDTSIVLFAPAPIERDIRRAQDSGADIVLVKPCLPETLWYEMQRLLEQSTALRERARELRLNVDRQFSRSEELVEHSRVITGRRSTLSRALRRHDTVDPPLTPPSLVCPTCDQQLRYVRSHIGGVNAHNLEQWDYYECEAECGAYQYRQRTRKLRRVC